MEENLTLVCLEWKSIPCLYWILTRFGANWHTWQVNKAQCLSFPRMSDWAKPRKHLLGLRWFKWGLDWIQREQNLPANPMFLCKRCGPWLRLQLNTEYFKRKSFGCKWQRMTSSSHARSHQNHIVIIFPCWPLPDSCHGTKYSFAKDTENLAQLYKFRSY